MIKEARCCYFCGKPYGLELHHALHGTANRKLADEDGLTAWLCKLHHYELHFGKNGYKLDMALKKAAEYKWLMDNPGKTVDDFRKRYGKDYLF